MIWQLAYEGTQRLEYERQQREWIWWLEKETKSASRIGKGKGKKKAASDWVSYEGFEGSELMDIWWDHVDQGLDWSNWDIAATSSDDWIPIEHDVDEEHDKWGSGKVDFWIAVNDETNAMSSEISTKSKHDVNSILTFGEIDLDDALEVMKVYQGDENPNTSTNEDATVDVSGS